MLSQQPLADPTIPSASQESNYGDMELPIKTVEAILREEELQEQCHILQVALEEAEGKVAQLQSALEDRQKDTHNHLKANEGSRTPVQSNPPRTPSRSSAARVVAQYTAPPSCDPSVTFQPSPSKRHKTSSWTNQASAPVSPSPPGRSLVLPLRSQGMRPDLSYSIL
jgi:hypothetical protein